MYMLYEDAELALGNTPAHTQHQVCIVYIQLLLYVKLITMECSTCKYTVEMDDLLCYNCYLNDENARLDCPDISHYQDEDELPF